MTDSIYKVLDFHKKFDCFYQSRPSVEVRGDTEVLRHRLLQEEVNELFEAQSGRDIVAIADALGDILYITFGTACTYGLQDCLEKVFNEIHDSNMSKLGADGKPVRREDGKILKGPNYFKPNIKKILEG